MKAVADGHRYKIFVDAFHANALRPLRNLPNFRLNKKCWSCDRTMSSYYMLVDMKIPVEDPDCDQFSVVPLVMPELRTKPWQHQIDGFKFFADTPGALLGYDMGTGKSLIAVAAAEAMYNANDHNDTAVLIVCPKAVLPVWLHQFQTHSKLCPSDNFAMITLNDGTTTKKAEALDRFFARNHKTKSLQVVVVNYESYWRGDLGDTLTQKTVKRKTVDRRWDLVILDESHKIKSASGKASKFAHKLSFHASRKLCLTGTPMPHSPADVFGQMRFLDSSVFGTAFFGFRQRFFVTHPKFPSKIIRTKNEDTFNALLKEWLLRVDSDEVLDLPDIVETFVPIDMSKSARKHYDDIEQELTTMVGDGTITVSNALGKLIKMRQITSGFIMNEDKLPMFIDDNKLKALEELLDDINDKEPVVIFTYFQEELRAVQQLVSKTNRSFYAISGQHHDYEKLRALPDKSGTVCCVQVQSGSAGIDLSHAAYCIYFSLTYSLGDYLQSRKRVHRPGQTRTTRYYHLTCTNTLDQVIYKSLMDKEHVVDGILSELKRHA